MAVTDRLEPHELHVTKYRRFSPLLSSVSGLRQVLHVTYSTISRSLSAYVQTYGEYRMSWLTDIPSQHILNLLLLESTLDNQSPASVD